MPALIALAASDAGWLWIVLRTTGSLAALGLVFLVLNSVLAAVAFGVVLSRVAPSRD